MSDLMPKSWNEKTKPDLFCPGCGHGIALKQLGIAIDALEIQKNVTLGIDIGCSLLAWNFFNCDTIQTHHGRTTSVMGGFKMAKPNRVAIAYMGDGAAYAIGLQSLLHSAHRNDPITVIVINNEIYAMTGGQTSPTTPPKIVTTTSPLGKNPLLGSEFHGPELISTVAQKDAFIARGSLSNPLELVKLIKKAIENQINNKSFSFVEILSICPTNWKTNASTSFDRLKEMESIFPLGTFKPVNLSKIQEEI